MQKNVLLHFEVKSRLYGGDAVALPGEFADGEDRLYAGTGKDILYGGDDNDRLDAHEDDNDQDKLYGEAGDDELIGGTGKDELNGGEGNDTLRAGTDDTRMQGGSGNDVYHSSTGHDIMTDESGDDVYHLSSGNDVVTDQSGYDIYQTSFGHLALPGKTVVKDSDGKGKIMHNGRILDAQRVRAVAESEWLTTDGSARLQKDGNALLISNTVAGSQGSLLIENFFSQQTFLGLALPEYKAPEDPTPEDPQNPKPPSSGAPLAAQSIDEKQALSFTVPDNAFQSGKDNPLSYSAQLADGKPLPAWLTFDSSTRTFSGTPGNDDVGTLSIELSAKGKGGSASQRFTLNILNVNDAPQAGEALADVQAERGKLLTYALSANAFTDIDKDDTLTLSATLDNGDALPIWLNFDAEQARFAGTPPADAQAAYRITVTATDKAGARIAQSFVLNIGNSQTNIIRDTGTDKILHGTAGNDIIYGNDHILPGGNYKEIHGLDGNDEIIPGKGRSILYGDAGNDILHAHGEEHLTLNGGHGDDIYRIGRDFKAIWIKNFDLKHYDYRPERFDIIELPAHQRNDFVLHRNGDNLYLTGKNGQQISIFDQFSNQGNNRHYIHEIRFADTTLTMADIKALLQNGTPGDDTLHANPEGELLYAGDGNDQIFGQQGNDRLYGENGNDIIRGGAGDDQLSGENGNDELHGEAGKDSLDGGHGDDILHGGADDDWLFGNTGHDKLHGDAGNDKLDGSLGDDWLWGEDGDDDLFGSTGNDVLNGGRGNDKLSGYEGNDTYHFARDFGRDFINNHDSSANRHDRIEFTDLNRADITIRREGNNLILRTADGQDQITVQHHFLQDAYRIDEVRFADGITLDYDTINRLVQGAGNTTRSAFRRVDSASVQQAQQMAQAMASFDGVQPLDALVVPEVRQPLLAVHNG